MSITPFPKDLGCLGLAGHMGLFGKCSGTSNLNIAAVPVGALLTRGRGVGVEGGVSGVLRGASHHSFTGSFGFVPSGDLLFSLALMGSLPSLGRGCFRCGLTVSTAWTSHVKEETSRSSVGRVVFVGRVLGLTPGGATTLSQNAHGGSWCLARHRCYVPALASLPRAGVPVPAGKWTDHGVLQPTSRELLSEWLSRFQLSEANELWERIRPGSGLTSVVGAIFVEELVAQGDRLLRLHSFSSGDPLPLGGEADWLYALSAQYPSGYQTYS
ncbi:hypothetical protein B0T21DRAFT_349196 [Apiosordaria backusii]|uniref:Uncharacterized protein n=1 Tax=Apiosordaria backusii TaxID=314023 RepID=A0AA40EFP0_9PEZI|nr:hypothetical protein B0T21DRAFT_349196 [Apiosordaria backusii]